MRRGAAKDYDDGQDRGVEGQVAGGRWPASS